MFFAKGFPRAFVLLAVALLLGAHGARGAAETWLSLTTTSLANPGWPPTPRLETTSTAGFTVSSSSRSSINIVVTPGIGTAQSVNFFVGRDYDVPLGRGVFPPSSETTATIPTRYTLTAKGGPWNPQELEILQVVVDSAGSLQALWCKFDFVSSTERVRGELKYRADPTVVERNQPPAVSVWIPAQEWLGFSIRLNGYAGDDGLPTGETFTTTWSMVSGPAPLSFLDVHALQTEATATVLGRYVIRLTASDSESTVSRDAGVSVVNYRERTSFITHTGSFEYDDAFTDSAEEVSHLSNDFVVAGGAGGPLVVTRLQQGSLDAPPRELFSLTPPPGQAIQAGVTFAVAAPVPGGSATQARAMIKGSEALEGNVSIREFTMNGGNVATAWLFYNLRTGAGPCDWVVGEFKYRASAAADADQKPVVRAVASLRHVAIDESVALAALVHDALSSGLVTTWTKVSGPGTVTFGAGSRGSQRASFSQPGVYVLRATLKDSAYTVSSDVTIEQDTRYSGFFAREFSGGNNPDRALFFDLRSGVPISASASATGDSVAFRCGSWMMSFASGDGSPLQKDVVYTVGVAGVANPGRLSVQGSGVWNSRTMNGEFTITEMSRNEAGTLQTFRATFLATTSQGEGVGQQAETPYRLRGEVRWRAAVPSVPANEGPTVRGGRRLVAWTAAGSEAVIDAEIDDDLRPLRQAMTYRWTQVDGPSAVTFDAATRPRTVAHFGAAGRYTLRLTANDGALSDSGDVLVVVGSALGSGRYNGFLSFNGQNVGLVKVTVSASGGLSGSIRLGSATIPFSGAFGGKTWWDRYYLLQNGSELRVFLSKNADGLGLTGSLTVEDQTFQINVTQAAQKMLELDGRPPTAAGVWNFILAAPPNIEGPKGNGFGRLRLASTGAARLVGVLADGTPFSFSGEVTAGDIIPVWLPLYGGRGWFVGQAELGGSLLVSPFDWYRPARRTARFPAGFFGGALLVASPFVAPPRGTGVLTLDTSTVSGPFELTDPEWATPFERTFTLPPAGRMTFAPADLSLAVTVTSSSGLFTGRFIDPATRRTRSLRGILLQGLNTGAGFFLTETGSGEIDIPPLE